MGVRFLNKFLLKKCSKKSGAIRKEMCSILENKVIAIDISIYLYKFSENNKLLENMLLFLSMCKKYHIIPLFVFDGNPPVEKHPLLESRKNEKKIANDVYHQLYESYSKYMSSGNMEYISMSMSDVSPCCFNKEIENNIIENNIINNENDENKQLDSFIKNMNKQKYNSLSVKKHQIDDVKELIERYGYRYIIAPGEADELCSILVHQNIAWACLSDDMDLFVYGCPRILRCLDLPTQSFMFYDLSKILGSLRISQENMRYICILCGTDYPLSTAICHTNEQDKLTYFNTIIDYYNQWYTMYKYKLTFIEYMCFYSNVNIDKKEVANIYSIFQTEKKEKLVTDFESSPISCST